MKLRISPAQPTVSAGAPSGRWALRSPVGLQPFYQRSYAFVSFGCPGGLAVSILLILRLATESAKEQPLDCSFT